MLRFCLAFLCILLALPGLTVACDMQAEDIVYRIDHEAFGSIGEERLQARCDDGLTIIERTIDVEVRLFMTSLHRRQAHYVEVWRDDQLVRFTGSTKDNGDQSSIEAAFAPDGSIKIAVDGSHVETSSKAMPTDPWHIKLIARTELFDRVDGHKILVSVIDAGPERLNINGILVDSRKFHVSGERYQELWFDQESGLWLRSKIRHPSGDIIISRQNVDVGAYATMSARGNRKGWFDARLD